MATQLDELIQFIGHPNPQLRLFAIEGAVPYSLSEPAAFKTNELKPIKHLKILIRDHPKIAEHALTILVNLSKDSDVLENLGTDDVFLDAVLAKIVNASEPNANLLAMLLANLGKWDGTKRLLHKKQKPPEALQSDDLILNQLLDLFVKGFDGTYNKAADYDYLAYLFADLAKHAEARGHFVRRQPYDDEYPLNKIRVFTEHKSDVRRRGAASAIKNVAFEVGSHREFLSDADINILPYLLLPIMGNEEFDLEESMDMLPDLQLLPPDKQRDSDPEIIQMHVETLTLLTTTRPGRDLMREVKVYPIIRETHLKVDHEGVREACERLVQVLMRDEAPEGEDGEGEAPKAVDIEDEENQIVEV